LETVGKEVEKVGRAQGKISRPDEIKATKISSRLNKGNNDLTGQVGQADEHGLAGY
jgi:hypothetical protein